MFLVSNLKRWRWQISQFAEKLWWKNYLASKNADEYLSWKRKYWQSFLDKIDMPKPINATILDAGCGPAGLFTILLENRVVAIDSLLDTYREQAYLNCSDYPYVEFIKNDLENFNSKYLFNYIFCINAINHVRDLKKCLIQLNDCLSEDGTIILSTDVHKYVALKKLFQFLPGDILHPHQYDLLDYETMLEEASFTISKKIVLKSGTIFKYCVFIACKTA